MDILFLDPWVLTSLTPGNPECRLVKVLDYLKNDTFNLTGLS